MNFGNNIKLDILRSVFCLKGDILGHVICYSRKCAAEMTCNGYILKHQHNSMVSSRNNLFRMDVYQLPLKKKF